MFSSVKVSELIQFEPPAHGPLSSGKLLAEQMGSSRALGSQELFPARKASTLRIKMPPFPHATEVKVPGRDSYQKVPDERSQARTPRADKALKSLEPAPKQPHCGEN